jgi:hypothetical protein
MIAGRLIVANWNAGLVTVGWWIGNQVTGAQDTLFPVFVCSLIAAYYAQHRASVELASQELNPVPRRPF